MTVENPDDIMIKISAPANRVVKDTSSEEQSKHEKAQGSDHQSDGKAFYGYALARGSKITPRNKKRLTFQIDGKWIRTHSIQLKPHDLVEAPVK